MKRHPLVQDLEPEALDPDQVVSGDPQVSSITLYRDETGEAGLWQITPGEVTDVEVEESFLVIHGRAIIEYSDGRTFTVGPGDTHRFTGGEQTNWKVESTLLKAWWAKAD